MRWLGLGSILVVMAMLLGGEWWHSNGPTFGDPPSEIHYHGCNYRFHEKVMSLDQAIVFEHQATYYGKVPVRQLGRTPAGRPFYGLTIGPGDIDCGRSPHEIYVQLPNGLVQQYMRGGGP